MGINLGLNHQQVETEYQSLIERLNIGIYMFDLEGNYINSNEVFQNFFGYSNGELKSKSLLELFFLEDIPTLTDTNKTYSNKTIKVKGKKKDKTTSFLELISVKRYRDSTVLHLCEAPNKYNKIIVPHDNFSIFEVSPLAYIGLNLDGNVMAWNHTAEKIFGWTKEEVINKPYPIIPSFEEGKFKEIFDYVILGNTITDIEAVRKKKDGTLIDVKISTTSLYDNNGKISGFLAIIEDISEQKEKDQKLLKTYNELNNFKFALDHSATVSITDPEGNIIYVNDMFCRVSKYERSELLGKNHRIVNSHYHPDELFQQMWSTITQGRVWNGEVRNQAKDGIIWWSNATIIPFLDEDGKPYQYVAIRSDITKQKEIEEQLRMSKAAIQLSEQRFRALVQYSHDIIGILDENGYINYISPQIESMSNYHVSEIIGKSAFEYFHPDDVENFKVALESVVKHPKKLIKAEFRLRDEINESRHYEVILKNLLDEPAVNGISFNLRDISENKWAANKIHQMAYFDQLTGFPNKKFFESYIKEECRQASKTNGKFSLIYLDMDGFKYINDSLGSQIGDTLLDKIAQRLKNCNAQKGIISRIEGDEFGILLPKYSNGQLHKISKEIVGLFKNPFYINEYELYITTNLGGSTYPYSGENVQTLISSAHSALYEAKEIGKNRFQVSSPHLNIATYKKFTLKNDLHKAIKNNEFYLEYQPRIHTKTNKIIGAEALIRWEHPKWGIISPNEFISLAEEAGLIGIMGEKVLYNACKQNKQWQLAGLPKIVVSVNFSVLQFLETDMLKIIDNTLEDTGLEPKWLEIEITETALMKDESTVLARIEQLKKRGINIAIDDFGTGYSSFSYLKNLKANTLKIDRSFIKNIPTEIDSTEIVSSVIYLAQKLKIQTVAEGVETIEQLNFLRKIHCDEIQGYI